MKNIYWGFLMMVLVSVHCVNYSQLHRSAKTTLTPLTQTQIVTDLTPYVQELTAIQIPEIHGQRLSAISKLIVTDRAEMVALVDDRIVLIDSQGTLLRNIAIYGDGERDFQGVEGLAVSAGGELMVLDQNKVRCYSLSDASSYREFATPVGIPFDAIAPWRDSGAYLFNAFPPTIQKYSEKNNNLHLLYEVDRNGVVSKQDVPLEDITISIFNISQSRTNRYFLKPQNNRHVFYLMTEKELIPEYKIDFGDMTIPARYYFEKTKENLGEYMKSNFCKMPMGLCETATNLYFRAAYENAVEVNFIMNPKTKKGIRWNSAAGDPQILIHGSDENFYYTVIDKSYLTNYKATDNHGPLYRMIVEKLLAQRPIEQYNDNPMIVKLKFEV